MNVAVENKRDQLNWSKIIKNNFDFKKGKGFTQLNLKKIFSKKECNEIYDKFDSNLNWIIRDSQKLKLPKNQYPMAKKLTQVMSYFRNLLQENIPERKHVRLIIETLRVARSDGSQHQVGSRWHQDHEAYFSLLINLTENDDPDYSTRFYDLQPKESYKFDDLGNPVLKKGWKENFIKPFHLGILNSGVRFFLFPHDKCRPIVHHAPNSDKKRLAIFATFSLSGVDQGMDLKDIYLPLIKKKFKKEINKKLKNLRNHWKDILGISNSSKKKYKRRIFQSENGLYKLRSLKFDYKRKNYRIVNFGLKKFENEFKKNKKITKNTVAIGELARAINYFSNIGNYSKKKLLKEKNLNLKTSDFSDIKNNNYDLFIQFKQSNKAFQLLSLKETYNYIDSFILILYPDAKNYIYNHNIKYDKNLLPFMRNKNIINKEKIKSKLKVAQMFTSFDISKHNNKTSLLLSESIKSAWNRGLKELIVRRKKEYLSINKNNYKRKMKKYLNTKICKNLDKVPFFLPRVGIDRKLPLTNSNSRTFELSKTIIRK